MIVYVINEQHPLAPSDEGAGTPNGVTGGEKNVAIIANSQ